MKTKAQQIRESNNPYREAVKHFVSRSPIHGQNGAPDKKVFYFDDGSFLTFEVSYMAVEDGKL